MIATIEGFITGTPWWVYVLFIYLVFIGIKASKGSVTPLIKMLVLPVIFGWMAIDTILQDFTLNTHAIASMAASLVVFIIAGYIHIAKMNCEVDRLHLLVKAEGTWSVLVLVLIIFFSKYYFGYKLATEPNIIRNPQFELSYIIVNAACIGYLLGKVLAYAKKMLSQPSVDLSKESEQ